VKLRRPYHLFVVVALFVMMVPLAACSSRSEVRYLSIDDYALGTFVSVICNTDKGEDEVLAMVREVDEEIKSSMSIFDESSRLSRVNRGETDTLDGHIVRNIEIASRFAELSDGAYDITIKPLTEAWGFAGGESGGAMPNVDSLLQFVGFDKIALRGEILVREDERVQLDFNSIAKGYTVDVVADRLESMGVEDYLVNIGGEIRCKGENRQGERWTIAIETPYDGNIEMTSYEKVLSLTDCALATSGNYRRFYYTEDGRKVAHTIDPRTGYSVVSELLSATVVAPTCAEADAAATMFMALGSEGGALELAKRCEAEYGWHYYFIYSDGEGYRVECSEVFE
jgi:thiamine biosynthesis lipoprotein